jgi:hypothetical protein
VGFEMHPEIARRVEKIKQDRLELIKRVTSLPADQQHAKPGGKGMSPAEVLAHFVMIERGNVKFLEKAPTASLKGRKVKPGPIYKPTVDKMRDTSKEASTLPMFIPKGPVDVAKTVAEFEAIRGVVVQNLEQAESPDSPFIKMMFLFGTLSVTQFLDLLEVHQKYHLDRFPKV